MRKTNELFKLLIPVLIIATAVAVIFAALALCLTYSPEHGNIDMKSAYAVFFVTTILFALIVPIIIVIMFKEMKITRTKRDLVFGKIASILVLIAVVTYTVSDLAYMLGGEFQIWRFFRALLAIAFAIFAVIEFLPSKIKISTFAKNFTNGCVPIYTAISILAIYFNPKYIPEYFKILFIIAYSALTLFFLYDFKWRLVKTNAKAYTAISTMAFVLPVTISLASIVSFIVKNKYFTHQRISISIFEMVFVFILGIYALSKVLAIKSTVEYVVEESRKRQEIKDLRAKKRQEEEDAKFEARVEQLRKASSASSKQKSEKHDIDANDESEKL